MRKPLRLLACATWLPLGLALASQAAPDVAATEAKPALSLTAVQPASRALSAPVRERTRRTRGGHGRQDTRTRCDGDANRRGDGRRPNDPNPMNPPPPEQSAAPPQPAQPIGSTSINSFVATPAVLKEGQVGKLEWSTTNVDALAIVPAPTGSFVGNSITIQPKSTTTYALNVAGPGGAALQFITVRVDSPVTNATVQTPPAAPVDTSAVANLAPLTPTPAPVTGSGDDKHPGGYTLVFNDEFNGTALDRTLWCTRYAYGGGVALQVADSGCTGPRGSGGTLDFLNAEQQRYKDSNSRGEAMHVFSNGILSLRATKTGYDSYAAYEAAMIRSKFEFKPTASTRYYMAARVRLPNVKGTWPAFWLAPGFGTDGQLPWPPEIDIFEGTLNGRDVKANMIRMGSQVHGGQTNSAQQEVDYHDAAFDVSHGNYAPARSLRDAWLVIGADWTQEGICYYVDGVKAMCEAYRWVTNEGGETNAAQLLLNLAIGGEWAGAGGIEDQLFPTSFDIDYVRVYRN